MFTDIAERKNAEETLREQHEFLQQVINNVPGLITVKDSAGRLQLVNQREAEIHGTTPAEMLGKECRL
jgi:PAS domain S-box-containing protein